MHKALSELESRATLRILVTLLITGPLSFSELANKVGSSNVTIYNALKRLKKVDLIAEEREEDFPRRRLISLTEKGRKIAKLLVEIEKILSEE